MGKLSLWLITLQKDRPFTFLDHALRAGDSLLGISTLDQLTFWSLRPDPAANQGAFLTTPLRRALDRAIALRQRIRATPTRDIRDAEQKQRWQAEADAVLALLKLAGDLLVAVKLHPDPKSRPNLLDDFLTRLLRLFDAHEQQRTGRFTERDMQPSREAEQQLRAEADALLGQHRPFHWPLEFPEVFIEEARGAPNTQRLIADFAANVEPRFAQAHNTPFGTDANGFAAFVGNPPFQGGQRITGLLGVAYRDYLVETIARGKRGLADLCTYFVLRAVTLLQRNGMLGSIATNTIAQGDTREVGLDQIIDYGFAIPRAIKSRHWPGVASLQIAQVWIRKGQWVGSSQLDDVQVSSITSALTIPGGTIGHPGRLYANSALSFKGSDVLGMGFVVEPSEAQALLSKDARNKDILYPFLNGEDLNSRPDQSPRRWIINFQDWSAEKAQTYPDCWQIVEQRVRPERQKLNPNGEFALRKPLPQRYWQYNDRRPALYSKIAGLSRVLAIALTSRTAAFSFIPNSVVVSHAAGVFALEEAWAFAVLQSAIHVEWAWRYGSSLKEDLRYTPSDVFETFPFPALRLEGLAALDLIGEQCHQSRCNVMLDRQEGLTKTYNRIHNPNELASDIVRLRQLHAEMDRAVAAAYGWTDLDLGHDFHETKQGLRFTISEAARREVLDRLLALNHQRYAEEVAQGLHDKKVGKGKSVAGRKKPVATGQASLTGPFGGSQG